MFPLLYAVTECREVWTMRKQTNFVKQELKKTAWKNRDYVDELMDIETFATGNYCSSGAGYIRLILKEKYPEQWKTIWLELNPKEYEKYEREEKKEAELEKKEDEKFRKEERLEVKRDREEWKRMDGK